MRNSTPESCKCSTSRLHSSGCRHIIELYCRNISLVVANAGDKSGMKTSGEYDYDLVIIGAGVGGHGAALHAVDKVRWIDLSDCPEII